MNSFVGINSLKILMKVADNTEIYNQQDIEDIEKEQRFIEEITVDIDDEFDPAIDEEDIRQAASLEVIEEDRQNLNMMYQLFGILQNKFPGLEGKVFKEEDEYYIRLFPTNEIESEEGEYLLDEEKQEYAVYIDEEECILNPLLEKILESKGFGWGLYGNESIYLYKEKTPSEILHQKVSFVGVKGIDALIKKADIFSGKYNFLNELGELIDTVDRLQKNQEIIVRELKTVKKGV